MNRIRSNQPLSHDVYRMTVEAPLIAQERSAGQFIILQTDADFGERIPLTIADASAAAGTITLIYQVVGKTTRALSLFREGDELPALVGPLGKPTHIQPFGTVVCVGGGIGVAPLYPIAQAMKKAGNRIILILGARNRELIILEEEMKALADEFILCTDDGSAGMKALVTQPLETICRRDEKPGMVIAIGPPLMMKCCAAVTKPFGIPTQVSLNTIMVDGTGMCGGCRVNVGGETKFVCVDGPEFDAHQVDFDNLMARLSSYREIEKKHHECFLQKIAAAKSREEVS